MKNTLIMLVFSLLFLSWCSSVKQTVIGSSVDVTNQKVVRVVVLWDTLTWWVSIHNYSGFGIKIYSDDPYSKSFQTKAPFIIMSGNKLVDPFNPWQYIQVMSKDPDESIQQIFDRDYLSKFETGCLLQNNSSTILTGNTKNIEEYIVSGNSWICMATWNNNQQYIISFFYNKNRPNSYYLYSYIIGCAPGKCNVFNQIELY